MISQVDNPPKKIKKTTRFARLANPFLNAFGRAPAIAITRRVPMAGRNFSAVQAAFRARFPKAHRDFLETLKVSATVGDYFFCHASVRPGVALDRQNRDDLLSIREPFLSSETEHGKVVVHGHTPSVAPQVRANRIGIDTAAYATGRLTCLILEKDQRRFLDAR
jgi:serine/threonine protein phosphatase 1